jgi:hypothetical protein
VSTQPNAGENLNAPIENARLESSQGIRRRSLTYQDVVTYALSSLGFPVVEVEAETQQLQAFVSRTLDEYNRWKPIHKTNVLTGVTSTINAYNLRDLNQPFGRGIIDVQIVSQQQFFSPISGVFALGIPHPISHLSPDQYDLALHYIKAAREIYSSEPDWIWEEPVLWLYSPTGYGGPFQAAYIYAQDGAGFEDVPQEDHNWVKDYFMNLLKRAVGEARGKFAGIPGPSGQAIRGERMIQEASDELKRLVEDIRIRGAALAPPFGLTRGY